MSPVDISAKAVPELNLFPARKPLTAQHFAAMALGSILVHILAAICFFSLPEVIPPPRSVIIRTELHKSVHIYLPKQFEPTQKAPNVSKVVRPELDIRSERETPQPQAPRYRPPQPAPGPVAPPVPVPTPPVIEPPKIQVATAQPPPAPPTIAPPSTSNGSTAQAPPPPESSKPKIAFENVAPPKPLPPVNGIPDPRLLMQRAATDSRLHEAPRTTGGGGITVGDSGDDPADLPRLNQTQAKGQLGSNLQLLSDANGFDFQPYLRQVLASVRRNWMSVLPESVKMGRRGQVLVQFIIDRHGTVPKLVIATSSGTESFDRAAVAGVSMSNPFPPLPADFKGDQIRVQLAFRYNAPTH
jgi:TonB family protein